MSNFKHATLAIASVALIGSLAVNQLGELVYRPVDEKLLSHGVSESIIVNEEITDDDNAAINDEISSEDVATEEKAEEKAEENKKEESEEKASSDITESMSDEELNALIEKKSKPQESYVILTQGTLSIMAEPSTEAECIDAVEVLTEVKVLSSTEGWLLISYSGGKQGWVPSNCITESKDEAEFAAKRYDNYIKATITTKNEGSAVRIRKGPSTSSDIVTSLKDGDTVLMLYNEGDFVKILYGEAYSPGYMVASSLTMTDQWTSKDEVAAVQAEAKRKAEEEAKKKAEEEAKRKAEAEAKRKAEAESKKASKKQPAATTNAPASSKGQAIVNTAKQYLGVKYVYGGSTPKGFDCSGLVKYVCAKNGISLSRTSASQARQGVTVSKNNLQPGDLLFFAKNGRVHHVGIYVGGGQMIHAPHTGSYVKYDSINTAYRQREFYCAKRVY